MPIYPREILRLVLDYNAKSIILAHNHPGGMTKPSDPDLKVTKQITAVLNTINVKVIDHIIVADDKFISFADIGLINN